MKKRIITSIVACFMLAFLITPPNVSGADQMGEFNKIAGTGFAYGDLMTREDFCVAISKIFVGGGGGNAELPFVDSDEIKPESVPYLAAIYEKGILTGNLTDELLYMLPNSEITRQEAITLLGKVLSKTSDYRPDFTDSGSIAQYAYGYIAWFAENRIVIGYPDGSLLPDSSINAGELAILTLKTQDYLRRNSVEVTTVSGSGSRGHADGVKENASYILPGGLACDSGGNIAVFDTYNNMVRILTSGNVKTLLGIAGDYDSAGFPKGYYHDNTIEKSLLNRPAGGAYSSAGELFFADSENNVIRFIREGSVFTFSGTVAGYKDGARETARYNCPMDIAIDGNDNIYVADTLNNCIRKVDKDGKATTVAGSPEKEGYADGASSNALFRAPAGIAVSADGKTIYVSDTGNHRIRKIENGQVSTLAGFTSETDEEGYPLGGYGDGDADKAMFSLPAGIILVDGVLLVADSGNNAIRAITTSGAVITVAGNGEPGDIDGPGAQAVFSAPDGICYYDGVLYIADTLNNKIKSMPFDPKSL